MALKVYGASIVSNDYIVGSRHYSKLDSREQEMLDTISANLESYHYVKNATKVAKMRKQNKTFFLDSGAFSAFTLGSHIDLKEYCRYITINRELFHCTSVLDAIGSAKGTYHNQKAMENLLPRELWPLPCYHVGEDSDVLKYYVDNYEHITIGGMVPIPNAKLKPILDELWATILTHPDGTPKLKVHGFGFTSLALMQRYPWFSVDSSSWIHFAINGRVVLPKHGSALPISSKSDKRRIVGQHVDTMTEAMTDAIEREIIEAGVDPDRLRELYRSRAAFNAWSIPEFIRRRGGGLDTLPVDNYIGIF